LLGQVQIAITGDPPVRYGKTARVEFVDMAPAVDEFPVKSSGLVSAESDDEVFIGLGGSAGTVVGVVNRVRSHGRHDPVDVPDNLGDDVFPEVLQQPAVVPVAGRPEQVVYRAKRLQRL
jgi:hypothetical protein